MPGVFDKASAEYRKAQADGILEPARAVTSRLALMAAPLLDLP